MQWGTVDVKERLGKYAIELTLVLLGTAAAALEAILVDRRDIALLLAFTSALIAIAVVAIRQEIARQISEVLLDKQLLRQIPDPRWRREAEAEIEQARARYAAWAGGTRRVNERSSLNFQIDALRGVKQSVRAVHLALESDSLGMWADHQRGFDRLVDAFRSLPDHVQSRRILVLNGDDQTVSTVNAGKRTIVDQTTADVCRLQTAPRDQGGLGFDLRISWVSASTRDITDLLIVDEREVCSIQSYGHGQFGDLEVCVNDAVIAGRIRLFEDLWTDAVPAKHCLPGP